MDKIKRFIDCYVPVNTCNLRCHYCYVTQSKVFDDKLPEFKYSPEHIAKSLNKSRLGGVCCLNFCGNGETLLPPEMTDIVRLCLEEGHYVMLVTNGTVSKRIDEIVQLPKNLLKRLFFKFSFHYLELKRLNIIDKFFENIDKIKKAGCSFTLELTPNDEIINEIEEIKRISKEKAGAMCHITIARDNTKYELPILTKYNRKEYKKIWSSFESKLFDYKLTVFNKKRNEFCYAGDWTLTLDLKTGELKQCYKGAVLQNIFEDIKAPISFKPIGHHCVESHCYNAHAFLTFGAIPNHKAPTYCDMRNRVCADKTEWVTPKMKMFFSQKLKDNNKQRKHLFLTQNLDLTYEILFLLKHILFKQKRSLKYSETYKKELKNAYSLLNDKESKIIFKARVKFLDTNDIEQNPIPKSEYNEYFHPSVHAENGDTVIDGGVSEWIDPTVEFSEAVGENGKIIAFEPEPTCYQQAIKQVNELGKQNVEIHPYGLWNVPEVLKITQNGRSSSLIYNTPDINQVNCQLITLDEFATVNKLNKIDFIKFDIEGAEIEALQGAEVILKTQKPKLAICVYHKPTDLFNIILYLNSLNLGYRFYLGHHRDNQWSTVLYAKSENYF